MWTGPDLFGRGVTPEGFVIVWSVLVSDIFSTSVPGFGAELTAALFTFTKQCLFINIRRFQIIQTPSLLLGELAAG